MSEELKPCPFCGGEAKEQNIIIVGRGLCKMVFCENCNIDFKTPTSIVQWNTRPAEDALKAENEELRYIVEQFKKWYNENGCPKHFDSDFPCSAETEYKNDPETEGDFDERDCWKQEYEAGCWVEYYRWKYKQEKKKGGKDE